MLAEPHPLIQVRQGLHRMGQRLGPGRGAGGELQGRLRGSGVELKPPQRGQHPAVEGQRLLGLRPQGGPDSAGQADPFHRPV
jgi:hypothetical protein